MATVNELKKVLKETLENKGVMNQLKAQVRSEVFNAMDDKTAEKPKLSNENLLINELIREYFEFNNYNYASSVLTAESGQPNMPLERDFIAQELGVAENDRTKAVPLLYSLVHSFSRNSKNSL